MMVCLALAIYTVVLTKLTFGPGPEQTSEQIKLVASHQAAAAAASSKAEQRVIDLMGDPATTEFLSQMDDGSGLHKLPPTLLAKMWSDELAAAELVHSFGDSEASGLANCGFDLTVAMGMDANR
jgi:hypothetical protein